MKFIFELLGTIGKVVFGLLAIGIVIGILFGMLLMLPATL